MTGGEIAQIITSLATLVAALGAVAMSWRNAGQIERVREATNGITDRLVATSRREARHEGIAEGRQIEKDAR